MKFSQFAGTAIVPTLSRIVLALAFATVGYNKLFTTSEFSAAQAQTLRGLGVAVTPAGVVSAGHGAEIVLASQDEGAGDDADGDTDTASTDAGEPALGPEDVEASAGDPAGDPADAGPVGDPGTYTARSLHKITLLCADAGWPAPRAMALLAALTECLGGVLLLVGFLSRVWGLGLAFAMATAFYLVTIGKYDFFGMSPFAFATELGRFNTAYNQLGLFVLAFGVFLTGPGPLSLDRLLFKRGGADGGAGEEVAATEASARPV
jgi:uncharacterized membrane protein YphA (DoxX/SURF4 family)